MAQPRKVVAARAGAPRQAAPAVAGARAKSANGLSAALTIFALFCVVGAIPAALGGEAFGYWQLPTMGLQLAAPPWSLSYDAPLAQPAPMFANATLHVVATPGGATTIATLEPGFVAQVTRYATRAGVRWAQIRWAGPTHAAGGVGWTPASGLASWSAAQAAQARNIGDMGALSPAFGQAIGALGPGLASALYFPKAQASYHTANIDQAEPLGAQVIPLVLAALYGKGIVAAQPNASNGPPPIAQDLATGNAQALTFDYALVGDAQGMDAYLTQQHITGFQFTAHAPLQAKGTARSLSLFYTALAGNALFDAHDSAEIIGLLANANNGAATAIAPQTVIGSGALVTTTTNADGGSVAIAAGVLTPGAGPAVVVVAIAHGATAAATQRMLQTYFGRLIALDQG